MTAASCNAARATSIGCATVFPSPMIKLRMGLSIITPGCHTTAASPPHGEPQHGRRSSALVDSEPSQPFGHEQAPTNRLEESRQ